MNEQFQELYQRLCAPITFAEIQGIQQQLKTIGDFNDDLLLAMEVELSTQRWGCLCKLIWSIPDPTPKMFSAFLCRLLNEHRQLEIMEAIVDAMFSLKDEKTVPCLTGLLDHQLAGDADCHFNRKIIYALANIGSSEAVSAIKTALNSPEKIIRITAQKELERLQAT